MDTNTVLQYVQNMTPSSFSEEERSRYQAEKMMLRQFMLLKQQNEVPDHIHVGHMKTWLLGGRNFMKECQELIILHEIGGVQTRDLVMAELLWTTARRSCLSQMEEEVQEELDKEEKLSQLLNRKITLEGLDMFISAFKPKAEKAVQAYLPALFSKLLRHFGGFRIPPVSSGDTTPGELLQLQESAAPVIEEVINTALKFLLEEPKSADPIEAASIQIGRLLSNSAAPSLAQYSPLPEAPFLGVCTIAAKFMLKSIFKEFEQHSKSFRLVDHDSSWFTARDSVISAVEDIDDELEIATWTPQSQLSPNESTPAIDEMDPELDHTQGFLEEQETSPEVSSNESTTTVTSSSSILESNVVVYMEPELEVLQEELEAEDFGVKPKTKKKKRVREFFRGIWRAMSCCFHCPSED